MKDFKDWGIKIRRAEDKNYYAIWNKLVTTRLDLGEASSLTPDRSEFYDVSLGTACNACCDFCYVSAKKLGDNYKDIVGIWKRWMDTFPEDEKIDLNNVTDETIKELLDPFEMTEGLNVLKLKMLFQSYKATNNAPVIYTSKPFQIAIGSEGEPTIHPDFCEFLKTVYETGVVPNYTTNGITLSDINSERTKDILEATSKYCGGVAVSYGNTKLREQADKAITNLIEHGNCKVTIHHLISDKQSVEDVISAEKEWKGKVHYHVLLPLMAHGRSKKGMEEGTFEYLAKRLREEKLVNYAVGANFLPYIKEKPDLMSLWEYPQEVYSKNILLKNNSVVVTPSSYNLKPIKVVNL